MTKFELLHNGASISCRIFQNAYGGYTAQIKDGKQWLASGAICHFASPNQALKWLKIYLQNGQSWQAVNLANLLVFGAGQIAA